MEKLTFTTPKVSFATSFEAERPDAQKTQVHSYKSSPSSTYSPASSSTEKQLLVMLSKVEQEAPKLNQATADQYKVFLPLFLQYKEEDHGTQSMIELISVKARKGLSVLLDITIAELQQLSDAECKSKLNEYFEVEDNSNYQNIIQSKYMKVVANDMISKENLQVYVGEFVTLLIDNPSFLDNTNGGASPKIMNELFINGMQPPLVRVMVHKLGTSNYTSTVKQLKSIYTELEIFQRWKRQEIALNRLEQDKNTVQEVKVSESQQNQDFIPCTKVKCNSKLHTPAKCWIVHPELRPEQNTASHGKKIAHIAKVDSSPPNPIPHTPFTEDEYASLHGAMAMLSAQFADVVNSQDTTGI